MFTCLSTKSRITLIGLLFLSVDSWRSKTYAPVAITVPYVFFSVLLDTQLNIGMMEAVALSTYKAQSIIILK